jgi:hypothetical protein
MASEENKNRKKISRKVVSLRLRQYYLSIHRRLMPENDGFIRRLLHKLSDERRKK